MARNAYALPLIVGATLLCCPLGTAQAQQAPVQGSAATAPAASTEAMISKACPAASATIQGAGPLPNLARTLSTRKSLKILSIGASTSSGAGGGRGYSEVIEQLLETAIKGLDVEIVDRGVSGELVRDGAERLKVEVALSTPDLVLWQVGTADALAQIPIEEFSHAVSTTLTWLKAHNVDVVLVGLNYARSMRLDQHYQSTRKAIQEIARAAGVLRIGRYEAVELLERAQKNASASVPAELALTAAGTDCLAEYVARAIASGIFVRTELPRPPG